MAKKKDRLEETLAKNPLLRELDNEVQEFLAAGGTLEEFRSIVADVCRDNFKIVK